MVDREHSCARDAGSVRYKFVTARLNWNGCNNRDGDVLNMHSVQNPVGGSVVWDGANVNFTPTQNFNGPASFSYTIDDGYLILYNHGICHR